MYPDFSWQRDVILLLPAACAAVLFIALAFFSYLFARSRESLFLSLILLTLDAFLYVAMEFVIVSAGGNPAVRASIPQVHRLEQVFVAFFIALLPLYAGRNLGKDSPFRQASRVAAWAGAAIAALIVAAAFIDPALYVSVDRETPRALANAWDRGRGAEGPLYLFRDAVLGLSIAYTIVVLALEMRRSKGAAYLWTSLAGLAFGVWLSLSDMIYIYTGVHYDPFYALNFSRTGLGATIFLVLVLAGILKRFLDQRKELEGTYDALRMGDIQLSVANDMMTRFVPGEFLTYLGKSAVQEVELGDCVRMNMTVLFSDIRSFTSLSERLSPEGTFAFINDYLSHMVPVIRDYDGFVDKFIGDAIMALFPGGPDDAVRAAIAMREQLKAFNGKRQEEGEAKIEIGIGIHSGELMMGTVGDVYRMQGTVISDAVNLASRMESLTKLYNAGLLMSEASFQALTNPARFHSRFIGKSKVKGKDKPVSVFEVFDGDEQGCFELKRETQSAFEQAVVSLYQGRLPEASAQFKEVAERNPADGAAAFYRAVLQSKGRRPAAGAEAVLAAEDEDDDAGGAAL